MNVTRYAEVLVEHGYAPEVISSETGCNRAKSTVEHLLLPERRLGPEEDALAKLLLHLIDVWESRAYPPPESSPRQTLRHLMEQKGLKQADLAGVFGAVSTVSEVLSGKRNINAKQARRLADYFGTSADLFV